MPCYASVTQIFFSAVGRPTTNEIGQKMRSCRGGEKVARRFCLDNQSGQKSWKICHVESLATSDSLTTFATTKKNLCPRQQAHPRLYIQRGCLPMVRRQGAFPLLHRRTAGLLPLHVLCMCVPRSIAKSAHRSA